MLKKEQFERKIEYTKRWINNNDNEVIAIFFNILNEVVKFNCKSDVKICLSIGEECAEGLATVVTTDIKEPIILLNVVNHNPLITFKSGEKYNESHFCIGLASIKDMTITCDKNKFAELYYAKFKHNKIDYELRIIKWLE